MFAVLAFVGLLSTIGPIARDGADEQYAFIAGLAEKGMHERVVKEAETFLAQYPRHAKAEMARYRMACALFELKDTGKAAPEFRKLASRRSFEFEAEVAFRLGQCDLEAGNCADAEASFQRAVEARKDYLMAPAQWLLGEAQLRCEHFAAARSSYAAVLALDSAGEYADDSVAGMAWCAFKEKRFDEAAQRAQTYLERYAKNGRADELLFLLGESLVELKKPEAALEAYRLVGSGPWSDGALRGAGFAQAELGAHAEAAKSFARVLADHEESRYAAECALHGGIEFLAANQPAEALRLLRSKAAGESVDVFLWRSRAEAAAGDKQAALKSLDRALELGQDSETQTRLRGARADLLASLGKKDEALREYERAGSDYALQAAAVAALEAGRTEDARRSAQRLLEQFPESAYRGDATMVVAETLLAEGRHEQAAKGFEAALQGEGDPKKRVRCRLRLAWCRYLGEDKKGAAASFAKLAREVPDAPEAEEAQFMSGRALEAAGDAEGAARAYDGYLLRFEAGPRREEALFRRAKLDTSAEGTQRLASFVHDHPGGAVAAQAGYELAERLSAAGKLDEAAAQYRAILDSGEKNAELAPAARYGLAWCLQQGGDPSGAAELLRAWLDGDAGGAELRASALELLVWSEARLSPPDGLAAAWRALLASPADDARLLRAARAAIEPLRKAHRSADALAMLDALGQRMRDPKSVAALSVERVYLELDEKRVDEAERELARAASVKTGDSGVAEAAFFVGEARFEEGDLPRALELYDLAAEDPHNPARDRALYKSGFARLKGDDPAGAERCFADLVANHPKSPLFYESLFLLGEAQYRQKEFEAACASFERVRKEAPQHEVIPKVLFRLGLARCEREDWKGALETLGALAARNPQFENAAEAELARGRALVHLDRSREAQSAFERTIALDKGALSARAHLELGRLHFKAGAYDPALSEFLKVAVLYELPEETAQALLEAGQTLEAQGDAARAIEQYREVVAKYAQSSAAPAAKRRLRELAPREKRGA